MSTIIRSGNLASRVSVLSSAAEAVQLYEDASRVPRTETRAAARARGVVIDGDMPVPGAQTALFFRAFKRNVPCVFKVPADASKAAQECALWLDVRESAAGTAGVYLVPVEVVELLRGAQHAVHTGAGRADVTPLKAGILMPAYACTAAVVPSPIDTDFALDVINRTEVTLRFIHSRGWLHGDVKPSNMFVDDRGDTWLGDYGTSVTAADVQNFTGGTPSFQCEDVRAAVDPLRFDLTGLAVSVLVLLGLLDVLEAPWHGWPRAALEAALRRVEPVSLRDRVAALMH
jgi:hypothetical protein